MASWPVRVDGKTARVKGSPALGGDTAEVLGRWLGIDAGKVAELKAAGVLGAGPHEAEKARAAG
jgi:crotonobetainyl-CoA:carnitine CoA-transferase CaiB-like acyl-CoA transferase